MKTADALSTIVVLIFFGVVLWFAPKAYSQNIKTRDAQGYMPQTVTIAASTPDTALVCLEPAPDALLVCRSVEQLRKWYQQPQGK